jgi:hypothetical protein
MSFTYDETLVSDLDYIRFRLDDIVEADAVLTDETIGSLVTAYGREGALVECCNAICLNFAKKASTVGLPSGLRLAYADRYKAYKALYDELKAEYGVVDSDVSDGGVRPGVLPFDCEQEKKFLPFQPFYRPT